MKSALVSVLFLAAIIQVSTALKCYECPYTGGSTGTDTCSSTTPFIGQGITCPSTSTFCMKTVNGETIERACNTVGTNPIDGCTESGSMETCYCQGDYCNGARRASASVAAVVVAATLLAYLM